MSQAFARMASGPALPAQKWPETLTPCVHGRLGIYVGKSNSAPVSPASTRYFLIDRYSYGFINVDRLGYTVTVRNGFMLLAFLALSYGLLLTWRLSPARKRATS